jgi:uncharacterized membrane protein
MSEHVEPVHDTTASSRVVGIIVLAWLAIYAIVLALNHLTLRTNAFDLSVFDYALWSTTNGVRPGDVPFYEQSLNSHHFMPTLWVLWPLHLLAPTPAMLIGVQLVAIAAAAVLLGYGFARRLPQLALAAIVVAFLFSRRSHVAITSVFYIESLEPLLLLALIYATQRQQLILYWICLVLALGCKEDVGIYTAGYGAMLLLRPETRRLGVATIVFSVLWVTIAIKVLIPLARTLDGIAPDYAFVAERYGDSPIRDSLGRLWRWESIRRLGSMTLAVGLICWLRPRWLLIAMPGIILNLAAKDEALQSGLMGHYLWPIMPFMFLAAIEAFDVVASRWPKGATVLAALIILAAIGDNPVFRPAPMASRLAALPETREIRQVLNRIPADASVVAQPQLIPHITQRTTIDAVDAQWTMPAEHPDVVVLSDLGDQWPLTSAQFADHVATMSGHSAYRRVETTSKHLFLFVNRSRTTGIGSTQ